MIFEYLKLVRIYTKPKGAPRGVRRAGVLIGRLRGRPIPPMFAVLVWRFPACNVRAWPPKMRPAPGVSPAGKLPDWTDPVVLPATRSTVEVSCLGRGE